jgi:hypothetical protein
MAQFLIVRKLCIMNKLYRNPGAWISAAIFLGISYLFFRSFPIIAAILFGSVILYISLRQVRSSWHLRKHGYRVRWYGRDSFYYEELEAGQIRRLMLDGYLMTRGPRHVYFPDPKDWQQKMPDWARDRRDEILARVRDELGAKHFRYYDSKAQAT